MQDQNRGPGGPEFVVPILLVRRQPAPGRLFGLDEKDPAGDDHDPVEKAPLTRRDSFFGDPAAGPYPLDQVTLDGCF
jgi:hypothetical protein